MNDNQALIMQQTIKLFQIHKTLNKILLKQIRYFLKQIHYPIVLSVWTKRMLEMAMYLTIRYQVYIIEDVSHDETYVVFK